MPLPLTSLTRSAILTALLLTATTALAFEGKTTIKSSTGSAITYSLSEHWVKGTLYRADHAIILAKDKKQITSARLLYNPQSGDFYALRQLPIASKKAGWVYDVIPPTPEKDAATPRAKPAFTPTGRTETIAGFRAAEYVAETATGVRIELWATKDLGRFTLEKDAIFKTSPWLDFVLENDLFMLRVVRTENRVAKRDEVLRIEKISLDETHFQLPADAVRAKEKPKPPGTTAPAAP